MTRSVGRRGPMETSENAAGAVVRCLTDIASVSVSWLWEGRIARGKTTLVAGDPGLGKSQLAIEIAARVSAGTSWPVERHVAPQGSIVLLNAEDDASDTIRPRFD